MALAMTQDDLFAPYRSGAFAAARRRVRQVAFDYCAAPDRDAYERLVLPMMIGLSNAPFTLPGPAEGSAAAEALVDGIVLRITAGTSGAAAPTCPTRPAWSPSPSGLPRRAT